MFEKEAKEYATRDVFFDGVPKPVINQQRKEDWQKGAEYGYNKAIEWHNLEKNPNDLPKNNRYVWCDYGNGYGKGCYHKVNGGWWIEGHMFCSTIDAWCELPRHDKGNE